MPTTARLGLSVIMLMRSGLQRTCHPHPQGSGSHSLSILYPASYFPLLAMLVVASSWLPPILSPGGPALGWPTDGHAQGPGGKRYNHDVKKRIRREGGLSSQGTTITGDYIK